MSLRYRRRMLYVEATNSFSSLSTTCVPFFCPYSRKWKKTSNLISGRSLLVRASFQKSYPPPFALLLYSCDNYADVEHDTTKLFYPTAIFVYGDLTMPSTSVKTYGPRIHIFSGFPGDYIPQMISEYLFTINIPPLCV